MRRLLPVAPVVLLCGSLAAQRAPLAGPPTQPSIEARHLVYDGAFRLPKLADLPYAWGGSALSIKPDGTTLVVVAHDHTQRVGEVRIPTPGRGNDVSALPVAESVVAPRDVLRGQLRTINPGSTNLLRIGGTLPLADGSMVVTAYDTYDASESQRAGHFLVSPDGTPTLLTVGRPGLTAGWLVPVPTEWQALLGTSMLTGQCCVSIISRTSMGPSLSAWTSFPARQTNTPLLLGYPIDHQDIGSWEEPGPLFNGTTVMRGGAIWPAGTRSVLFFGTFGTTFCYGGSTSDPRLHGKVVNGNHVCYDPVWPDQGSHGFPYISRVWAYDANDLVLVKNGRRRPWALRPYATWELTYPFANDSREIWGSAYDPTSQRVFVSATRIDGDQPLIHTWRIAGLGEPGTSPTAPSSATGRGNRPAGP